MNDYTLVESMLPARVLTEIGIYLQSAAHLELAIWQIVMYSDGEFSPTKEKFLDYLEVKKITPKLIAELKSSTRKLPPPGLSHGRAPRGSPSSRRWRSRPTSRPARSRPRTSRTRGGRTAAATVRRPRRRRRCRRGRGRPRRPQCPTRRSAAGPRQPRVNRPYVPPTVSPVTSQCRPIHGL